MSLTLYHHGGATCAAKVRFCLAEKGLEWEGVYLDILKGDQFDPEYRKLNPKGVVPTLIHDDNVIVESTVINDYLDYVFPDPPLTPVDPFQRAQMQIWLKALDEYVHPSFAEVNFSSCLRHLINKDAKDEVDAFLSGTPDQSITPKWRFRRAELVRYGFEAPGLAENYRLFDSYLTKMHESLSRHKWLAGETFSLADIGLAPSIAWLSMLNMDEWWEKDRAKIADWLERIRARPAFGMGVTDWLPAEMRNTFGEIGTKYWPDVRNILATFS